MVWYLGKKSKNKKPNKNLKSKSKNKVNESDHEAVSTKPDQKQSKPQKQVKNPLQSKLKNKKLSIERTWSDVKGCRKAKRKIFIGLIYLKIPRF